jgi:site-specific DNA-methyltransferase (adenine-specific)
MAHKDIIERLNKIIEGDVLDVLKTFPDKCVDCVITSPPYNAGDSRKNSFVRQKYSRDENDDKDKEEYFEFIVKVLNELLRVVKYHIFFNIAEIKGNKGITKLIMNEFWDNYKETFIWHKTNPNPSMNDLAPTKAWEYIHCLSHDRPDVSVFTHCNFHNTKGHDNVKTVLLKKSNAGGNVGHNFAFPTEIPLFFIKYFSVENDIILDPFIGSGTVALSARQLNRKWLGIEHNPAYIKIAQNRLRQDLLPI